MAQFPEPLIDLFLQILLTRLSSLLQRSRFVHGFNAPNMSGPTLAGWPASPIRLHLNLVPPLGLWLLPLLPTGRAAIQHIEQKPAQSDGQ